MNNIPISYKKFVIQLQGNGFKSLPNAAGQVASFWVVSKEDNIRSIFAFSISMSDSFEGDGESEDNMLEAAVASIKQKIDNGMVIDLEEYTYKYKNHQFHEEDNPNWWTKSLKQVFNPIKIK